MLTSQISTTVIAKAKNGPKHDVIKHLAHQCGLPVTGTKRDLRIRLWEHLESIEPLANCVASLDLGLRNLAIAVVHAPTRTVHDWRVIDLTAVDGDHGRKAEGAFCPRRFECTLEGKLRREAPYLLPSIANNTVLVDRILIERQRHRTNGHVGVLEHILGVIRLEAALYAKLGHERCRPVLPQRVAEHFALTTAYAHNDSGTNNDAGTDINGGKGNDKAKGSQHGRKKRAAIKLVSQWLGNPPTAASALRVPVQFIDYYRQQPKRDDLADALLQVAAYLQWHDYSLALKQQDLPWLSA